MSSSKDFLHLAIKYRDMSADIHDALDDMSDEQRERLKRAVAAVDVLQIEEVTSVSNRIGYMYQRVGGYPTVEHLIYDHFDTCIDRWGDLVSIMQPYDHVMSYDIRQELAYIAAGIVLTGGPMRGFVGLLDTNFSWHNLDRTVLIAHTGSPTRYPDAFTYLLYYNFDSVESAWWYLASHGKKCSDRILWFDKTRRRRLDDWWREICNRDFVKYPWVVVGDAMPFLFDEKRAFDAYGDKCR